MADKTDTAPTLSSDERWVMRHALGLSNPKRRSYRNYFVTNNTTSDFEKWTKIVSIGLAEVRSEENDRTVFRLTKSGALLALNKDETLDPEDFPQ